MGAFGAAFSIVMVAAPEALLAVFTRDPEVIRAGVPYVRLLAITQAVTGVELVMNGAFSGAGDTVPPMLISTTMSLLRIPLAWWFAVTLGLGLPGLALMITITCAVRTVILVSWFRRGGWRTKALATLPPAASSPLS
jgi:Na+-driven multidrug efflux pump